MSRASVLFLLLAFAPASFAQVTVSARQVPGGKFALSGTFGNGSETRVPDGKGGFSTVYNGGVRVSGHGPAAVTFYAGGLNVWSGVLTAAPGARLTVTDGDSSATVDLTNVAPVVASFSVTSLGAGSYRLSGTVTDECPGGLTVAFDGPDGVRGTSATVTNAGTFSVDVKTSAASGTAISAAVVDWFNLRATRGANVP